MQLLEHRIYYLAVSLQVNIWAELNWVCCSGSHKVAVKGSIRDVVFDGLTGEASPSKLTWLLAAFSPLQVVGLGASVSC